MQNLKSKKKGSAKLLSLLLVCILLSGAGVFYFVSLKPLQPVLKNSPVSFKNFPFYRLNGKAVYLSDFTNKVVLLHFWATWCVPCLKEIPSLNQLAVQFPENLVILAISSEQVEEIKVFLQGFKNLNSNFIPGYGEKEKIFNTFDIQAFPETYIFDHKGQFVEKHTGPKTWPSHTPLLKILKHLKP